MSFRQSNWVSDRGYFSQTPVTFVIMGLWVLIFLLLFGSHDPSYISILVFDPRNFPLALIGLITYPLLMGGIINLLFSLLMLYQFGGSLERSWGSRTYLLFLIGTNTAAALLWELGLYLFTGQAQPLATPWLMVTSVIVAWAWLNPEQNILLYFVLPVKAIWIGWLSILLLYFLYPSPPIGILRFVLNLFALGGVGATLLYLYYRRTWGWIPRGKRGSAKSRPPLRHSSASPMSGLLSIFKEWQRRRRIAHLQRSIRIDDDRR